MASGIHIDVTVDTSAVRDKLAKLAGIRREAILKLLGQLTEQQVKRRIASEKRAPDGTAWKPNHERTSILVRSGLLRDSIHHAVESDTTVRVGSGLVYAAIHQTGGTITPKNGRALVFFSGGKTVFAKKVTLPARPYLGYSSENQAQVERHLIKLVEQAMA